MRTDDGVAMWAEEQPSGTRVGRFRAMPPSARGDVPPRGRRIGSWRPAMAARIWHNWQAGAPEFRSLIAHDQSPGITDLDAVAATWTIEAGKDGTAPYQSCVPMSHLDLRSLHTRPGVRRAGVLQRPSPALTLKKNPAPLDLFTD